jgi:hypothetical protein
MTGRQDPPQNRRRRQNNRRRAQGGGFQPPRQNENRNSQNFQNFAGQGARFATSAQLNALTARVNRLEQRCRAVAAPPKNPRVELSPILARTRSAIARHNTPGATLLVANWKDVIFAEAAFSIPVAVLQAHRIRALTAFVQPAAVAFAGLEVALATFVPRLEQIITRPDIIQRLYIAYPLMNRTHNQQLFCHACVYGWFTYTNQQRTAFAANVPNAVTQARVNVAINATATITLDNVQLDAAASNEFIFVTSVCTAIVHTRPSANEVAPLTRIYTQPP